jgi:methyl-accepting chemotaxis protein
MNFSKIGLKILLGFLLIIFLIGFANFYSFQVNQDSLNEITEQLKILEITEATSNYGDKLFNIIQSYQLITSEFELNELEESYMDYNNLLIENINLLESKNMNKYSLNVIKYYNEQMQKDFKRIIKIHKNHLDSLNGTRQSILEKEENLVFLAIKDANTKSETARNNIMKTARENYETSNDQLEKKNEQIKIGIIFSIILSIIISFFIANSITKPIIELNEATKEVQNGNLDFKLKNNSSDEIGNLINNFNIMIKNLKGSSLDIDQLENKINERTDQLKNKLKEFEKFHDITIDRELKMIELKNKIKRLEDKK